MSKSSSALSAFLENWERLKSSRPAEGDFSTFGYPLSYGSMDELFARWHQIIEILDEKGYWTSSPEVGIADAPLAGQLNNLSSLVVGAVSNGVSWLLSAQFLDLAHNVQSQLSVLTRRQAALNKSVAKLLEARSAEEMEEIVAAARDAKSIRDIWDEVENYSKKISEASEGIATASEQAKLASAQMAVLQKEASESSIVVGEDKASIQKSHAEVAELKRLAIEREKELERRATEVSGMLDTTEELAKHAYKSVEDALKMVRDQGLAKSFQDRSNSLQAERRLWTIGFAGAALVLLTIAIVFSVELPSVTYEALLVHLLRKIGLAAPLVWVGWYASKQVGRIARVQEDYEYKAASALAFQSYKEEAKLGADPELEKRLLDHAIKTFGENPVRLYEHHDSEPVSPLQAAIKELPPEKIAAILAAVGEQSVKAKFWPLGKVT
ncbi:hypothetical protein [Stenotrophomonas rhizophila]|uniref:hypothetical protein n=1 Tax=Stenotrophomonas rhizophila TaxID=216778 RepID=UPI001AEC6272|nr:hypothetical protein [Stenotrophomonas rhizophila]